MPGTGPPWGSGWGRGTRYRLSPGATAWLHQQLAHGPVPATEIMTRAERAQILPSGVLRARAKLDVRTRRRGQRWWWFLPPLVLLLVSVADARTIRGVLGDAQELVGIRPAPAFTHFASHFATVASDLIGPQSPTSAVAALAGSTIDSSESPLGPIFQDHAETLGAGVWNLNAVGARPLTDGSLYGQPFLELGQGTPGLTVLKRTPTGNPTAPALTGVRLQYHLDLRVWSAAVALSYGVTDALDLSLVLPIVATQLDCAVSADLVRASTPDGRFVRVPETHLAGTVQPVSSTGLGDLVARAKYQLPIPRPWRVALTLEGQFPTGEVAQLHGAGAYWITPGLDVSRRFWNGRAELAGHGALSFNISQGVRSQADYGLAASVLVWPRRLALVTEFLGRSQLDQVFTPVGTDVLTYTGGAFVPASLLGVDWGRRVDTFDFAFGFRWLILPSLVLFAAGSIPLNPDVALRPTGVTPTFGIGGVF